MSSCSIEVHCAIASPALHFAMGMTFNLASTLCRCAQVLCALVSSSDDRQRWLFSAGILPLLQRLTVDSGLEVTQVHPHRSI